ncbi:MAG: hypothetical protein AMXMBFR7_22420 [Planctomycetota bacterium]
MSRFRAAWIVVCASVLLAPTCVCAGSTGEFEYKGIAYVSWWLDEYLSADAEASLDAMAATGADSASILVTWYQDTKTSSEIHRVNTPPNDDKTPSDAAVREAIRDLKARGLKVMLKPHVDVWDGSWRGEINPSDKTAWFASYTAFITHYATLAQEEGVELFCIGCELKLLTGSTYLAAWTEVIDAVRGEFTGPLTYAANAAQPSDEYQSVAFWDQLDFGGVDVYFPLTNLAAPSIAQLEAAWSSNRWSQDMLTALRNWQSSLDMPVLFTEIGYQSADLTNQTPWWSDGAFDEQEQADCYEAAFRVWTQESAWLKGMFWWGWTVGAPAANDTQFNPRGKPAAGVLLDWYGNQPPVLDSPLSATPNPAVLGEPVAFACAGSDPDGDTLRYRFDPGDGSAPQLMDEPDFVYSYQVPGTYTAQVVALDEAEFESEPSEVDVTVDAALNAGGLYVKQASYTVYFDRLNADKLALSGQLAAGCLPLNPNGIRAILELNGVPVLDVNLDAAGRSSSTTARVQFNAKNGAYSIAMKTANLRASLNPPDADGAGVLPVLARLTLSGGNLVQDLELDAGFEFATVGKLGRSSTGKFLYARGRHSNPVFLVQKVRATPSSGGHLFVLTGLLAAAGDAPQLVNAAGDADVAVALGAQTVELPFEALIFSGVPAAPDWRMNPKAFAAPPELRSLQLRLGKRTFQVGTGVLLETGLPGAGEGSSLRLPFLVRVELQTDAGVATFEAAPVLSRSSLQSGSWK